MNDKEFLNWVADRLVHVYGESENVDFVLKLRQIAGAQPAGESVDPRMEALAAAEKQVENAAARRKERAARLGLEGASPANQDARDAARYRWLTDDLAGDEREARNRLLERMAVMSYSASCDAIDEAMRVEEESK